VKAAAGPAGSVPAPAAGAGPGLVHGMGRDLAEPDWPPLTGPEVQMVLASYPAAAGGAGAAQIRWWSPRPLSAAALVSLPGGTVFVKRHHQRVRAPGQLAAEHAFAAYVRERGLPVPEVLATGSGATTLTRGEFSYEVHAAAPGIDLYRDAVSWSPYSCPGHARAAGAALARLHLAAAGFRGRTRPPAVLTGSAALVTAPDPLAALGRLAGRRPGLARALRGRPWQRDFTAHVLPLLPRQWGHGDWHPSNLTWTGTGPDADVAGIFDFGLANRTYAVHDLATALERATIGWLDLPETGRAAPDLAAATALLDGYESVRPLMPAEAAALPQVLPVVHVEYALSELEYFADVVISPGNASLAYEYLVGHARWAASPDGRAMLDHLRGRARRATLPPAV
jgi:Ser/Thr protein kinase RdoA (MazF antagonist)